VNKTARRVWEFRNTPDIFGPFMGDQQRHADGGITIGWGGTAFDPKVTELHADGSKAFEIGFGSPVIWTYRAFRFPWQTAAFTVGSGTLDFGAVEAGEIASQTLWITNPLGTPLALNQFPVTGAAFSVVDPGPIVIAPGDSAALSVQFAPDTLRDYAGELYVRSVDDLVLIAQPVALHGTGTGRSLSIDDVTGREGDDGVTPFFHFTLRLDAPATTAVTVQYATEDSTATAGDGDYLPVSGSATIAVGDSTADVAVIVIGDATVEPDEIFHLRLLGATHAVIARPWARGKILGDDGDLAVEGPEGQGPAFALYPVLPNPARDEVALRFDLPAASRVSLEIYDVRGRHVATLVDGLVPAGHQSAVWHSGPRPGGVYFARLKAGSREISRKLVIVR
jgi:hypothetical protein